MKTWLILGALAISTNAFADPKVEKSDFSEKKASILKRIGEEKAAIEQFSTCVTGASSKEDLQKCRESREASMKSIRKEHREERKKHLQDQLQKLEAEGKND